MSYYELKLGIMTNKELATWFGIQPATFSKNKEKKLEELKAYADFEQVGNKQTKINIKQIYEPVYQKKGSQSFEIIKNKFDTVWSEDGLDTCSRVCYQILETTEGITVKESTAYNYTIKSRNDLYGKPFQGRGSLGSCRYVWGKKDEEGRVRKLTDQEEKIKQDLIKKYFGDASQKQIFVQAMVEAGEISKEQAWDVLIKMTNMQGNNFLVFLKELQEKIGCKVVRATQVDRIEQKSAFELKGDK